MSIFTKLFAEIFRDYATDKVPASGVNEPAKSDIRQWGAEAEAALDAYDAVVAADAVNAMSRLELARRRLLITTAY